MIDFLTYPSGESTLLVPQLTGETTFIKKNLMKCVHERKDQIPVTKNKQVGDY